MHVTARNWLFIPILIYLSLVGCAFLPPKLELPETISEIDELEPYLDRAVERRTPPSISIAVARNNGVSYLKSFGYIDIDGEIHATPQSVYQWWSITKLFTAVAILQLQERGLLNVDDSVLTHLPTFITRGKGVNSKDITIAHLLSHSSGLGDIGIPILGWVHFEEDERFDQTDLFNSVLGKYNKLKSRPGKQGRYSNFGYLVLAAVIESVSGMTYEDYILKNIVVPLGMDHTNFIYTSAMDAVAAKGSHPSDFISKVVPIYLDIGRAVDVKRDGVLWFNHVYSNQKGASGLIGPVTDLIKFLQIFLPGYEHSKRPILNSDSILLMQRPIVNVVKSPAPVDGLQFGFAWFIDDTTGELTLSHGGGGMAFVSMLSLYPEKNLVTVVMANSTYLGRSMGFKLNQLLSQISW